MGPIQSGPPTWAWFQPKINYQLIKFQPKTKIFNPEFTVTFPAQIDMKVCMTYSFSITVRTSKFQDFTQWTRNNRSSISSRIWTSSSKVWLNLDQKVTIQQNMKLQQQSLFFLQKMKLTQKLPDHLMLRFLHFGEAEAQLSSPTQFASSDSPLGWDIHERSFFLSSTSQASVQPWLTCMIYHLHGSNVCFCNICDTSACFHFAYHKLDISYI